MYSYTVTEGQVYYLGSVLTHVLNLHVYLSKIISYTLLFSGAHQSTHSSSTPSSESGAPPTSPGEAAY